MAKARIAVIGAGLMGHGIAQVFALAGHDVTTDADAPTLATAVDRIRANLTDLGDDVTALTRVHTNPDLSDSVRDAGYIVEAVREDLDVKRALFAEIERVAQRDAIVASNTSVIPITAIMGGLARRERALGTHWWNPAYLIPLVEVIGTEWTSPAVREVEHRP
jgi:3-hydroxybutyryl-CoA dehydrogenase